MRVLNFVTEIFPASRNSFRTIAWEESLVLTWSYSHRGSLSECYSILSAKQVFASIPGTKTAFQGNRSR